MALLTCTDCQQPVPSEAAACPGCGRPTRDKCYLTPGAQALVGGLVLVACLAWAPLFFIVVVLLIGRLLGRARRGSKRDVHLAIGLTVLLAFGLYFVLHSPAGIVVAIAFGVGTIAWLVAPRLRPSRSQV